MAYSNISNKLLGEPGVSASRYWRQKLFWLDTMIGTGRYEAEGNARLMFFSGLAKKRSIPREVFSLTAKAKKVRKK